MTGTGSRGSGHWRYRLPRRAAALVGLAMLAACSGSPPAGSAGSSRYQRGLAYAQCMRSHGVANFPDPDSEGRFIISYSNQVINGVSHGYGVNQDSPQSLSASKACQKLWSGGSQPTAAQQRQQMSALLRVAGCVRSHGIPNFPDPTPSGGGVTFNLDGLGIGDPAFVQSVMQTCMKLTHFSQGAP